MIMTERRHDAVVSFPSDGSHGSLHVGGEAFGRELGRARLRAGLSLGDVERACNGSIHPRALRAIERGRREASHELTNQLAAIYGVRPEWLTDPRDQISIDLRQRLVRLDGTDYPLHGVAPTETLDRMISLVRSARDGVDRSGLYLRTGDLEGFIDVFGPDAVELVIALTPLIEHDPASDPLADTRPPSAPASTTPSTALAVIERGSVPALCNEPRPIDTASMAELERLYDRLTILETSRVIFGHKRRQERHEQLTGAERRLLDQLGFDSWIELMIGISSGRAQVSDQN